MSRSVPGDSTIPVHRANVVQRPIEVQVQHSDDKKYDSSNHSSRGAVDTKTEGKFPDGRGREWVVIHSGAPHEEGLDGNENGKANKEEREGPGHKT